MDKKYLNISSNFNLSSDKKKYTSFNNVQIHVDNSTKNHFNISSTPISKKFIMNKPYPHHTYLYSNSHHNNNNYHNYRHKMFSFYFLHY